MRESRVMRTSDFDYQLPPELIAQRPATQRDASRLMALDRTGGTISHRHFPDLLEYLHPGDVLVFNDTRVIPARLWCRKETGARVEFLFVRARSDRTWEAAAKPLRRLREGMTLQVEAHPDARLRIDSIGFGGTGVVVSLVQGSSPATIEDLLVLAGQVPLPPYIHRPADADDTARYQTVYAARPGAIAAPTAGLHFTSEFLARIRESGVSVAYVTLHVGIGTFRPVSVDDPREHPMHEEVFAVPAETVAAIKAARERGGRVIAVGTTVVRVLEHCAGTGELSPCSGSTRMLILPGYAFRIVNGLITNFHLPQSTLLMLVSAFASRELVIQAYEEAVRERYRFFSYGDAMVIV